MKKSRIAYACGLTLAAVMAFGAPLLVASSAQAAASCTNVGTSGTIATASCTGTGYAQLNVRCNAIWPFPTWTDYGTRTYVNGGLTLVNGHESCGASTTVWVVYG